MTKVSEYLQFREKLFDEGWAEYGKMNQAQKNAVKYFNSKTIQTLLKIVRDDVVGEEMIVSTKHWTIDGYNQKRQELIIYFRKLIEYPPELSKPKQDKE